MNYLQKSLFAANIIADFDYSIFLKAFDKNRIRNTMFFTDDGYSGTDFNRPDFRRMEAMVERGEIGTIIVKDLSRFARNYIEAGNYIEG